jgi:hypothetical protein
LHEASTQPPVVIAANALIDETIPADRADLHAGVDVTGRPVDPATVSDIVQTVRVLLRRKAGS